MWDGEQGHELDLGHVKFDTEHPRGDMKKTPTLADSRQQWQREFLWLQLSLPSLLKWFPMESLQISGEGVS